MFEYSYIYTHTYTHIHIHIYIFNRRSKAERSSCAICRYVRYVFVYICTHIKLFLTYIYMTGGAKQGEAVAPSTGTSLDIVVQVKQYTPLIYVVS